jgi:hypothetical protein
MEYLAIIHDLATATDIGPSVALRELLAEAAKDGFGTFEVAGAASEQRAKQQKESASQVE